MSRELSAPSRPDTTDPGYLIRHLILEAYGCPYDRLDSLPVVNRMLKEIARLLNTVIMAEAEHHFQPHGVTSILIVGASHLSAHTWPELGYATVDLVICTDDFSLPEVLAEIRAQLAAASVNYVEFRRGPVRSA